MARHRTRGLVAAGALLAVAAAGWWWTRGREHGAADKDGSARGGSAAGPGRAARMRGRPLPQRAWQHLDMDARRVAGTVTYKGAPVAGATVRLQLDAGLHGAVPPEELRTGSDGRFDFGPRVGARSRVSATAADRAPAATTIDLRDPTLAPPPDQLVLELRDCTRTAEGSVHDAGGPIAGATVRAGSDAGFAITTTDAAGAYRMCVAAGGLAMSASADGYARAVERVEGGHRVRQDFELLPEVELGGVVLDEEERPVAGALVSADPAGEGFVFTIEDERRFATTGDDGRFMINGVGPGRYGLSAQAAGRATSQPVDVTARVGEPSEDAVLHLAMRVVLRGVVVADGKPVPGIRVWAWQRRNAADFDLAFNDRGADTVTRADGTFTLDGVAAGPVELRVQDHDLLEPASIVASLPETDVTLVVAAQASISGRVVRQGAPAAGAQLNARTSEGRRRGFGGYAEASADGSFTIRGLEPGTYDVGAQVDSAFARGVPVTLTKGQRVEGITIELDLAGEVSGVVVDQRGSPVAGASVRLELGAGVDFGHGLTEEDGTFVAGAMSGGGDYAVSVRPSRGSEDPFEPAAGGAFPPVHVADGQSRVSGVRLVVKLERGDIRGVVVHPDGKPAADVTVTASHERRFRPWQPPEGSAHTGADGRFALRGMRAGSYSVHARTGGQTAASVDDVATGRSDVRLVLPPTGSIEGTLSGFGPGVTVSAHGMKSFDGYRARVEGSRFSIRDVPVGTYMVNARDHDLFDGTDVTVTAGKASSVKLATDGVGRVVAQVIDAKTRAPLSDVECSIFLSGGSGDEAVSDAAGKVTLVVPARRDVSVHCHAGDFESQARGSTRVRVDTAATREVTVEITRPRTGPKPPVDLGMTIEGPPPKVASVTPGGAAERAGLRAADVLVSIDGTECDTFSGDLARTLIAGNEIGDKVKLVIERGGNRLELELEIVGA